MIQQIIIPVLEHKNKIFLISIKCNNIDSICSFEIQGANLIK